MKLNKLILFLLSSVFFLSLKGQNLDFAKEIIDSLTSPRMQGRGYVFDGDKIAAKFITNEFQKLNLKSFNTSGNEEKYSQRFSLTANTFPYNLSVKIGNEELQPGLDYLVAGNSGSTYGKYKIKWFNKSILDDPKKFKKFQKINFKKKALFIDKTGIDDGLYSAVLKIIEVNLVGAPVVVSVSSKKLQWEQGRRQLNYSILKISRKAIPFGRKKISVNIKNDLKRNYQGQNLIGYIEGQVPDSFVVVTAHYDHLGRMGQVYFPGANDNASGIAMMLDLANHYSKNNPKYSIAFIAFSGEELGLVGSKYYTENPLFSLKKIKFLINLDMMGNGEKGITVVNGKVFEDHFEELEKINSANNYFETILSRGYAQNSDHYYFTKKGVPSFFIFTNGGTGNYHDIQDKLQTLTFGGYNSAFKLIIDFISSLNN
ncbi:MAG: M20/M25/M40 family metallo-hydrolase [Bacteroidia bacterium]|nr:M20/M25/M40 family metallo-hydrolase [Bacteroidia bacterium]